MKFLIRSQTRCLHLLVMVHYLENSSNAFRRLRRRGAPPRKPSGFAAGFNNFQFFFGGNSIMKLYKFISKNTNEKGRHARSTSAPDHFHRFSELGRHELDGITHNAEAVVGLERERSVAHALAVFVLLPHRYRLAVGTEERLTRFEVDAHGALVGNLLAVLVERIGERPDSPHRGLADTPEFSADRIPHLLELVGELHELAASEQEAHHVVRPLAAGVLGVDALLVEGIYHLVPRCLELSEKLHEGAFLGRLDDHDAARVILALHALLLGFPIQTLYRSRYCVWVREAELQCNQTDGTIQCDHGGPPFGVWVLELFHAVLPINCRELRAKLREIAYGKELYFATDRIADYIELVKPNEATKKTSVLGLFLTTCLIKNFSFLLSKSPIRFCPENSIQTGRRAKRGGFLWLAISEMVPPKGLEPLTFWSEARRSIH